MPSVFEVEAQDISDLSDLDLTKLLKKLLHLEAQASGIAERSVEVALNITVSDGGEDGRIEWREGPENTNYLPSRLVQFQNKATNMGPTACANEIVDSEGNLKSIIGDVLEAGGSYILFTTDQLNTKQKRSRIKAIRDKLKDLGKAYWSSADIKIYDASSIQGWVNKFASAIVAVKRWVGRPMENGLSTWEEWNEMDGEGLVEYVPDEPRVEIIDSLRTCLNEPRQSVRMIGLSGLGKTRLALESFRDTEEGGTILSKQVVYIDAAYQIPNLPGLISEWVRQEVRGILVVDNCELELHKQIKRLIEQSNSKMSLLSMHYELDVGSQDELFRLKQMEDACIKQMLEPVYGAKISDLDRIVSFAQGFPLMAVLLADARLDQASDMGVLTDDDLLYKMLWPRGQRSEAAEKILRGCSLFDKFGLEEDCEEEASFIAREVVHTSDDDLYECIRAYEKRGIVNRAGRYAQIVPKPLAIRLAADWWSGTHPRRQEELIGKDMPGQLADGFCSQIAKMDSLPEVKELTEGLCGVQGPFGQAEVILSERGSRLFCALVEVNPYATSEALFRVLRPLNHDGLYSIKDKVRRNLVRSLEKLCFHREVFEQSGKSLLWLASAENENWGNNATGCFKQLFGTMLSSTEAGPELRLRLIDYAMQSDRIEDKTLAVGALESAISTYGGSRMVGAEYQGSGKPLEEWRPKIWKEAFDYWAESIDRLGDLVVSRSEVSSLAKKAVASHIRGLMQYGRVDELDRVIKRIVAVEGPLWPDALEGVKSSLNYEGKQMPEEGKEKLHEWIAILTPESLDERIKLFVSIPPFEHEKDANGNFVDMAAQNAERLASELSSDINVVEPFLPNLLQGEQRKGYWFGLNLVLKSRRWEPLLSQVILFLAASEKTNPSFMYGLLDGVYQTDSDAWESYISTLGGKRSLAKYYPSALTTGNIKASHLDHVLDLIKCGDIDVSDTFAFTVGRALDGVEESVVIPFVTELSRMSNQAAWMALDILSMYCYGDNEKREASTQAFRDILLALSLEKEAAGHQLDTYHWSEAANYLLDKGDVSFAQKLSSKILDACNERMSYGDLMHYVKPVTRKILSLYGKEIWPIVAKAIEEDNPLKAYRLTKLFSREDTFESTGSSVLSELDADILFQWCKDEPDTAPVFVARAINVFVENDEGYEFSSLAKYLIDEFGGSDEVLSALSSNMGSFGWSGSVVPYYKKELVALNALKEHKIGKVREWIARRISYLEKAIATESKRDEESSWGIR